MYQLSDNMSDDPGYIGDSEFAYQSLVPFQMAKLLTILRAFARWFVTLPSPAKIIPYCVRGFIRFEIGVKAALLIICPLFVDLYPHLYGGSVGRGTFYARVLSSEMLLLPLTFFYPEPLSHRWQSRIITRVL